MPRLFVAIDLPEEVKSSLSQMSAEIPGAKWVGAAEIHLPLRFIGEVSPQTFSSIRTVLSGVSFVPFSLSVSGVGHFPPHGHPRVLWVALEQRTELTLLQQQIEATLQQAGVGAEERPFSPHIPLPRLKETPSAVVARFEAAHKGLAFPPFAVDEFILYSSVLTPRGAVHRKEAVYRAARLPPVPAPS